MGAVTGGAGVEGGGVTEVTGVVQGLWWDLGPGRGSRAVGLPYSGGGLGLWPCAQGRWGSHPPPRCCPCRPHLVPTLWEEPPARPLPPGLPVCSQQASGGIQREVGGPACFPHPSSVRAQIWDVKLHTVCSLHFLLPKYFDGKPRGNCPTFILCYRGFWAANISRSQRSRPLRAGRSGLRGARGISSFHCSVCH